jgi:tungstate transport system substrate-binding protein
VLLQAIKEDTGLDVQLIVVATVQALHLDKAGEVDTNLVHSHATEEAFLASG